MSAERWRWRSSAASSLSMASLAPTVSDQYALRTSEPPEPVESRKPRLFARALGSLSRASLTSLDSVSGPSSKATSSLRRLHKSSRRSGSESGSGSGSRLGSNSGSGSGSALERFQRRVSREPSIGNSSSASSTGPSDQSFASMDIIRYGWLKADTSLLKARSEYLVLTDHSLVKFSSAEAARAVFPQLGPIDRHSRMSLSLHSVANKSPMTEIRLEIPLRSIVAVFNQDSSASRSRLEIWWFSRPPKLAYCKAQLSFMLPKERNDWLSAIQQAYKVRMRKNPTNSVVPENVRIRINHALQIPETSTENGSHQLIFPVANRSSDTAHKGMSFDDSQGQTDGASFYLVIGPYLCYFISVLKADDSSPPGDLRVKSITFGTVTLTRFEASVASHEQRFSIFFRSPFDREHRLDLASAFYRRIIEALTKVDRILKPMWPQNLQQSIFQIKGLPPPLQLTSGNDLGGLEMSLQAYCVAFDVPVPSWTIEWNTPSQPAFRLLPSEGSEYTSLQLLAVFRSLRYNSFFKAISFRDVDLSSLAGKKDCSQYGDCVVFTSLSGLRVPDEHYKLLLQCTVLEQEIHNLLFASESIRSVDFTKQQTRVKGNPTSRKHVTTELLKPIVMLFRRQLCHCHSISISGNLLSMSDIDELANVFEIGDINVKKLELAKCGLTDTGLTRLWSSLPGLADTLECLDTSENQGTIKFHIVHDTLAQLRCVRKLNISGNTRLDTGESLFLQSVINQWSLRELNLSNIALNDSTVDVLAGYLEVDKSKHLQVLHLNNSNLTGVQFARLFRSMGQARQLTVHMNANRIDEGIDDLCRVLGCGFGPWSLFMQMTEFAQEANYVKFLRALTVNKAIECLSLAGTVTSDALSSAACEAVSDFFRNNDTVRFLDISGYVSKLDEGRLGREFSKALSGMRANSRIEHLRVRSQMLNINIGDLAAAISDNKTLHTLDCEGNNFNLSNFRHLIKHMESNTTIRHLSAFSEQELDRIIQKSVHTSELSASTSRRALVTAKFKHDKGPTEAERPLGQRLQDEWDSALNALSILLERNQKLYQEKHAKDSAADDEGIFASAFAGLARHASQTAASAVSPRSSTPMSKTSPQNAQPGATSGTQTPSDKSVLRTCSTVSSNTSRSANEVADSIGLELDRSGQKGWTSPPILGAVYDEDDTYYYIDDDAMLQVGRYGRFLGDPASRIEEEDDRVELDARHTATT